MVKRKEQTKIKKRVKLTGIDRVVDLLERIGVAGLYLGTNLCQNSIANKLGMDINRVNAILKGLKKKEKANKSKK